MKRSELIELLEDELQEVIVQFSHKHIRDKNFYKRKADGIIDLLQGLEVLVIQEDEDAEDQP